MALTPSNMLPLGIVAPFFSLPDTVSGQTLSLDDVRGEQATVIMFTCNHCPYVIHVNEGIVALSKDYAPRGVSFVAISSNDVVNYPQDSPEKMTALAAEVGYDFPYLYDESQAVALAYDAACTPDFYVFDAELKLVYRGRIDASRPKMDTPIPVTGADMRQALDAVLVGKPQAEIQYPSMGCNIKWKKS
jgi:peroxiredoxin